jgi:hypothetical protein
MKRQLTRSHAGWLPALTNSAPNGAAEEVNDALFRCPTPAPAFNWPQWAHTARLAGAYFHPSESDVVIAAHLDQLAAQYVSVIIADSPLGEQYAAWLDDAQFEATRALMARVVSLAHSRSLKVVLYHTALEFIAPADRNPGKEHPQWMQRGLGNQAVLFDDVSNEQEHWLHRGEWDVWMHPCDGGPGQNGSFRSLAFSRIADMVLTGIDGLWIDQAYLQSSVGAHHDLWPSTDPCSAAAFKAATALDLPRTADWGDPVFRRWIVWRHTQIAEYVVAEMQMARKLNPQIVCFHENSCVDSGRSTYVAADPASLVDVRGIATAHEVETIADRMDFGATGMHKATLEQWLAFRTMIAFARAVDRGKPSWILTYGWRPRDSAQLAGFVLAEGANFYENKGPQMAASVGSGFRKRLFGWIAAHEADLYAGLSAAEVGLLYSPANRDLVDQVSGEPYNVENSRHFAAYRAAACELHRAHIPFDIVLDTDVHQFDRFHVLIAPALELMSDTTALALCSFSGALITIGATGGYNEWLTPRIVPALAGRAQVRLKRAGATLAQAADTGLLRTSAPATLQLGLHTTPGGYRMVIVNTARHPTKACTITLRLEPAQVCVEARLSMFAQPGIHVCCAMQTTSSTVCIILPAGIETAALLRLQIRPARDGAMPPHA